MKKGLRLMTYLMVIQVGFVNEIVLAQGNKDTLPYDKIYAFGMDADVTPIFEIINDSEDLSNKDVEFKNKFEQRFSGESDARVYDSSGDPQIDELLGYFRDYWRTSLLDPSNNYMMNLGRNVMPFLMKNYPKFKGPSQRDSLGNYLADYIRSRGFNTTEQVNPNGSLVDLLIWKKETKVSFDVALSKDEIIEVPVLMMEDFVTLGWVEYATLGRHHPGGWTTESTLQCVKKSYDLESESFEVSYLAHEGRHFADKKIFKDLTDKELEYRAKLTELSLAKKSIYDLIEFFINNANPESLNGHQLANHQLIVDLSKSIFNEDYESNFKEWKKVSVKKINKTATELLNQHTRKLESS